MPFSCASFWQGLEIAVQKSCNSMDSVDIVGETAADFVAAATFAGARHDFVFHIGENGIGYYRDGGAARKVHYCRPTCIGSIV